MIQTRDAIWRQGIAKRQSRDWRVRIVFIDGTDRVVRLNGRISEEQAVQRALLYAKVFDRSVVDRVLATQEEPDTGLASRGIVTK